MPNIDSKKTKTCGRFYGVYLLCSQSTERKYKSKCYIGFTVNPNRRINQHNRGKDFGGARKTNNKGPWKMVMIVHGFPNNISALQFEWAWQSPTQSSRLKHITELARKKPKETYVQYNFRILTEMLSIGPWNRLPLIIQWLESDYEMDFDVCKFPPSHMKIVGDEISTIKAAKTFPLEEITNIIWASECHLCMKKIDNPDRSRIGCPSPRCKLTCHIICLANHCLANDATNKGHYVPINGECPLCETKFTWSTVLLEGKNAAKAAIEDEEDSDDGSEEDNHREPVCLDEIIISDKDDICEISD